MPRIFSTCKNEHLQLFRGRKCVEKPQNVFKGWMMRFKNIVLLQTRSKTVMNGFKRQGTRRKTTNFFILGTKHFQFYDKIWVYSFLCKEWISLLQKNQQFWGPWILGTELLNVYSHERIFKNMVHKDLWLVLNSHCLIMFNKCAKIIPNSSLNLT